MDIDFSLILVVAFLVTGISWALIKFKVAFAVKYLDFPGSLFSVIALVLVLRSFLFEPFQIPSGSMIPTLKVGDFILVNKYHYGLRLPVSRTQVVSNKLPQRGDVMVFIPPHKKQHYIKRILGIPGDKVQFINDVVYVNDVKIPRKKLGEIRVKEKRETWSGDIKEVDVLYEQWVETWAGADHVIHENPTHKPYNGTYIVPEGHYFMVGDNRDNSSDSRSSKWPKKFVPEQNIVGKAVAVWMHWDEFLSWPDFSAARSIQ